MNRIVFVLGGARSGKSRFAESLALEINHAGSGIALIATGEPFDSEFSERIRLHRERRSSDFITYEESVRISDKIGEVFEKHNVFILECLTTWLGNLFEKKDPQDIEKYVTSVLDEICNMFENSGISRKRPGNAPIGISPGRLIKGSPGPLLNPRKKDKTLIIVSNELGLGIVPNDPVSRFYRDVHGRMNQKTASCSDYAYFLISGIPVRIL